MKRVGALLLALLLVVLLAACAQDASSSSSSTPPVSSSLVAPESVPEEDVLAPLPLATDINALTGLARPEGMQDGQRPVAVMVANDSRAMPQRGLAAADVIYEMLTEDGVTRIMAMYADYNTVPQVGPVRSTRDAFVQFAMPADAILAHIGSSVYAKNLLNVMEYQDIDGLYLGSTSFYFDTPRSLPKPGGKLNEYCWFTDAGLIWAGMEYMDVIPTGEVRALFNFAKSGPQTAQQAYEVDVSYSDISSAGFVYDEEAGLYTKTIFGATHADEDGTPLAYTNLIFLTCDITLKPDGKCTEFDLSRGKGIFFSYGTPTAITWEKGEPGDALRLFGPAGNELPVQPGKSYIGIVPSDRPSSVVYRSKTQVEEAAAASSPPPASSVPPA